MASLMIDPVSMMSSSFILCVIVQQKGYNLQSRLLWLAEQLAQLPLLQTLGVFNFSSPVFEI
jgi:hypothetical protein